MQRILIKVSGEVLSDDSCLLENLRDDLKNLMGHGIQVALVIGGGNMMRGRDAVSKNISRLAADRIGILSTIVNGLFLQDYFSSSFATKILSSKRISNVVREFSVEEAIDILEKQAMLILVGGTGSFLVTTDSAASLRAFEIGAKSIFKMTKVDGVYEKDPLSFQENNKRFSSLSFQEAIDRKIEIMDLESFVQCQKNNISICVFGMKNKGVLSRIVLEGSDEGTWII